MFCKIAAGLVSGVCAGLLVFAFLPRIEPPAATEKAAVEQPEFVKRAPAAKATLATVQPVAPREAISKLASALRAPGEDTTPIASLTMPIDEARRLFAEGLVAFAKGDVATARAFLKRAAEGGDGRALVALGDTYDPAALNRLGAIGIKGDESAARDYYARAQAAGVSGARERIASLAAR